MINLLSELTGGTSISHGKMRQRQAFCTSLTETHNRVHCMPCGYRKIFNYSPLYRGDQECISRPGGITARCVVNCTHATNAPLSLPVFQVTSPKVTRVDQQLFKHVCGMAGRIGYIKEKRFRLNTKYTSWETGG